jgi:hypothetical protein
MPHNYYKPHFGMWPFPAETTAFKALTVFLLFRVGNGQV